MLYDKRWELDKAGKVLLEAAEYMEQHGWCRDEFFDDTGAVCLLGAIRRRQPRYSLGGNSPPALRLQNRIYEKVGGYLVATWNDEHCESKEQAVTLLRSAAYSS
jgi:hypothetical protein